MKNNNNSGIIGAQAKRTTLINGPNTTLPQREQYSLLCQILGTNNIASLEGNNGGTKEVNMMMQLHTIAVSTTQAAARVCCNPQNSQAKQWVMDRQSFFEGIQKTPNPNSLQGTEDSIQ